MKAAIFYGPRDVRVEDAPKPKARKGEILVRVLRCAVCGTDKRIYTHGQKNVVPPAITGHEIVGLVEELGKGVAGPPVGRRPDGGGPVDRAPRRAPHRAPGAERHRHG